MEVIVSTTVHHWNDNLLKIIYIQSTQCESLCLIH